VLRQDEFFGNGGFVLEEDVGEGEPGRGGSSRGKKRMTSELSGVIRFKGLYARNESNPGKLKSQNRGYNGVRGQNPWGLPCKQRRKEREESKIKFEDNARQEAESRLYAKTKNRTGGVNRQQKKAIRAPTENIGKREKMGCSRGHLVRKEEFVYSFETKQWKKVPAGDPNIMGEALERDLTNEKLGCGTGGSQYKKRLKALYTKTKGKFL